MKPCELKNNYNSLPVNDFRDINLVLSVNAQLLNTNPFKVRLN
jgi:hypothetical protein